MSRKERWSRKTKIRTEDDRFDMAEALFGHGSFYIRFKKRSEEIVFTVVKHLSAHSEDCSVRCFRFEGHARTYGKFIFRGQYDFIRKDGWIQEKMIE